MLDRWSCPAPGVTAEGVDVNDVVVNLLLGVGRDPALLLFTVLCKKRCNDVTTGLFIDSFGVAPGLNGTDPGVSPTLP